MISDRLAAIGPAAFFMAALAACGGGDSGVDAGSNGDAGLTLDSGSTLDAGGSCDADPRVGTDCIAADGCEVAAYACVGGALECVGSGVARAASFECRPSAGDCDLVEVCNGTDLACPADSFLPDSEVCLAAAGDCDVAEYCTGTSADCPADELAAAGTVCRASANIPACDPPEVCTGSDASCPLDEVTRTPTTETCNNVDDDCDGTADGSDATESCPGNLYCGDGSCREIPPPRLVAPLSTETLNFNTLSDLPSVLRSEPPAIPDHSVSVTYEICSTPDCSGPRLWGYNTNIGLLPFSTTMPAGVVYWRAFGAVDCYGFLTPDPGCREGSTPTDIWSFIVPNAVGTRGKTHRGNIPDFNGDGLADLAMASSNALWVIAGRTTGTPTMTFLRVGLTGDTILEAAGDINGDGFGDLLLGTSTQTQVYYGSAMGLSSTPGDTINTPGWPRSAGDVNGDGYADAVLGTTVYHGSPDGLVATPTALSCRISGTVVGAGEINGDGYADVVCRVADRGSAQLSFGVFIGGPTGLSATPTYVIEHDEFGYLALTAAVAVTDVDGDGLSDVRIAFQETPVADGGYVRIWYGHPNGVLPAPGPSLLVSGLVPTEFATGRDVNGNGRDDLLLVRAPGNVPGDPLGSNYTVEVRYSDLTPTSRVLGPSPTATPGAHVVSVGDMNGDGYADVAVGDPEFANAPGTERGRLSIYYGSASGLNTTAAYASSGNFDGERRGSALAGAH